jgi:hypothetical protein
MWLDQKRTAAGAQLPVAVDLREMTEMEAPVSAIKVIQVRNHLISTTNNNYINSKHRAASVLTTSDSPVSL